MRPKCYLCRSLGEYSGRGSLPAGFAVVTYVWDVTSRVVYALKKPLPGAVGNWKREAEIMKDNSHMSIIYIRSWSSPGGVERLLNPGDYHYAEARGFRSWDTTLLRVRPTRRSLSRPLQVHDALSKGADRYPVA